MDYGAIYATKNDVYAKLRKCAALVRAGVPAKGPEQTMEVSELTHSRARPLPQGAVCDSMGRLSGVGIDEPAEHFVGCLGDLCAKLDL